MEVVAELERRQPAGLSSAWSERHRLDVCVPDLDLAVSLQIAIRPTWGLASFLAAVLERGQRPVVIADSEVPVPDTGWEVRTSGLWADHVCETELEHWSYGLEAFGLAIDDPGELLGRAVGERVPLGWELEFEAGAPAVSFGAAAEASGDSELRGYAQSGIAHGILLSADGRREIEGVAVRTHAWGTAALDEIVVGEHPVSSTTVVLPDVDVDWVLTHTRRGLAATPEVRG